MDEHEQRLAVTRHGVVLDKTDLGFENAGALNPACIRVGEKVHIFYRAVRHGNYSTIGHCLLNGPLEVERRAEIGRASCRERVCYVV